MADEIQPDLRASDLERERTAVALREHASTGRLDVDELEERLGLAYAARTRGELAALRADLPALDAGRRAPAARPAADAGGRAARVAGWLALAVLLVAIWALTGGGYFWPVWPILGTAFGAFGRPRHGAGHACGGHRARHL